MIFLLACYGVTFVLCDAKVTARPRAFVRRITFLDQLLGCYFCVGFWIAAALGWWTGHRGVDWFLWSFAGATAAYVINTTLLCLERWADHG